MPRSHMSYKRSESLALSGSHRTNAPRLGTKGAEAEGQADTEVDRAVPKEGGGKRIPMQSRTKEKVPPADCQALSSFCIVDEGAWPVTAAPPMGSSSHRRSIPKGKPTSKQPRP